MNKCIINEDEKCIECGKCNYCDLDPEKICDNCCKCIEQDVDFASVLIDRIEVDRDLDE